MANSHRSFIRLAALGLALGLALAVLWEAGSIMIGRNYHVVISDRVYRSAQPYGSALHHEVRQYGIKTVINLRGCNAPAPWYVNECRATADLDVAQEDLTFSAGRLPDPVELRRLIEVLDRSEYPVLLHCQRGVDRTGLTSAIVQILYNAATLNQACAELGLRHGHVSLGRTAAMLRFFDLYKNWLARTQVAHSAQTFREYVSGASCPGPARGRIEAIEETSITAGKAGVIRLRATNLSDEAWRLKAGTSVGIHLRFQVFNDLGEQIQVGQAGLFAATVAAGKAVLLTLPINRVPRPGKYTLFADLLDGPDTGFTQLGGEMFVMEFHAR